MPGSQHGPSILNARVYEALRRKGMSKRRAAAISNAQRHKDAGVTGLAIPPTGPNALFNQPGASNIRTRRKRYKAARNWGARAGQTIAGHLRRGATGRFESDSGGTSAESSPRPSSSRERRRTLRDARQKRREDTRAAREADRAVEATKRQEEDDYIAAGKTGRERQRRRAEVAAARRARSAERRRVYAQEAEDERQTRAREDADQAKQDQGEKPKKDGGGGGKKKQSEEEKLAAQEQKRASNRKQTAPKAGLSTEEADWLAEVASGTPPTGSFDGRHLAELGLTQDAGDTTEATDAGRRLLGALERGDVRGALAAIQDGKARLARERARAEQRRRREEERQRRERERKKRTKAQATFGGTKRADLPESVFAGPDRSFPIKTAQDVRDAVRSIGRTKHDKAAVKRGIIRRARAIGAVDALPESWREKAASAFAVFKDATGADRWLAITTTAYQDKDDEWITRKAIRGVVEAGDRGAPRGPLRYWHVPGLDLGDCDYQATAFDDRVLIESGTFRSKAAARIGQEAARRGYEMSPGFLHTPEQPRGGAFDRIALFERSFVPPGRASNPYTRLLTKEARMLTDEKKKEFEALASDPEGQALLTQLLAQAQTTVKANDEAGAIYKDAPPWAQALIVRIDALEAQKAAPPAAMGEEEETIVEDKADDMAEMDMAADEGAGDVLDDEGFADLIVQKLLAQLAPMLELEKKVAGYLDNMKGMLQPVVAKDDARAREIADLQSVNAALDKRLKELEGGQPRARTSLNADVWGQLSGIQVTKEQATAASAVPPSGDTTPPSNMSDVEQAAHKLIWGPQN